MSRYYILKGHEPQPIDDALTWMHWFGIPENRIVAQTTLGGVKVSTVFLGLDHGWGSSRPVLFETMVFADDPAHPLNEAQERYCTWEEAEEGHRQMVERVRPPAAGGRGEETP
jgi:hypothetical protein